MWMEQCSVSVKWNKCEFVVAHGDMPSMSVPLLPWPRRGKAEKKRSKHFGPRQVINMTKDSGIRLTRIYNLDLVLAG